MERKCSFCGCYGEPYKTNAEGDKKHLLLVCQRCGNVIGKLRKRKKDVNGNAEPDKGR